ncbi:hypothetical protein [Nocardiopsis tropica]|uniref:Uncharacterized protein n=1 Tax=Nocardiopsis tropica TaxID=109330 RepID=A0ABU7KWG6_9ACTN|nr:hypothetical protein [Nocardiopsis umidischolae]MEE2053650.1 hypothetical protein [Nocardiopsis umidischolae]
MSTVDHGGHPFGDIRHRVLRIDAETENPIVPTDTAVLLLACSLLGVIAVLIGVGAAYLARRDRCSWPTALIRAAAAMAATATVAAAVTAALTSLTC